jgi:hypothetical protein
LQRKKITSPSGLVLFFCRTYFCQTDFPSVRNSIVPSCAVLTI